MQEKELFSSGVDPSFVRVLSPKEANKKITVVILLCEMYPFTENEVSKVANSYNLSTVFSRDGSKEVNLHL